MRLWNLILNGGEIDQEFRVSLYKQQSYTSLLEVVNGGPVLQVYDCTGGCWTIIHMCGIVRSLLGRLLQTKTSC